MALAVLPKDMKARFIRINQIRNRFAHRLTSEIEDEDVQALWDGMVKHDRSALRKTNHSKRDNLGKFGGVILITYYRLDQLHSFASESVLVEGESAMPNPAVERTRPGKPGRVPHVKR